MVICGSVHFHAIFASGSLYTILFHEALKGGGAIRLPTIVWDRSVLPATLARLFALQRISNPPFPLST